MTIDKSKRIGCFATKLNERQLKFQVSSISMVFDDWVEIRQNPHRNGTEEEIQQKLNKRFKLLMRLKMRKKNDRT